MRSVREWQPIGLDLRADRYLIEPAMDDIGDDIDADIERHRRDQVRFLATKIGRTAPTDRIGEDFPRARHFAPFEIAVTVEEAVGPRNKLVLAAFAVELQEQFLLARSFPIAAGEAAR